MWPVTVSADAAGRAFAPARGLRLLAHGAFWFFLLKGLAWLIVPALLAVAASS